MRLLNRRAGGRASCMDTGTLPIVRPGFLKKWTFYFSSHPPGGGAGSGQTWPKHPTPLPQQQPRNCKCRQGLVEGSPERELTKGLCPRDRQPGRPGCPVDTEQHRQPKHPHWITLLWVSARVFGKKPPKTRIPMCLPAASVAFDPRF